jgi:succinate dehydrogenase/fumarate reductase flavoprotein subunit
MRIKENRISTDILVIGGGFAGVFAALRAREQGFAVTLVDKGSVGRSGQTPWADSFHVFDENKGCNKEVFHKTIAELGDDINIGGFLDMIMEDSKNIFEELKEWGAVGNVKFGKILDAKVKEKGVCVIQRTMLTHLIKKENRVIGAMGFPLDHEQEVLIVSAKAVVNCAGAGCYKSNGYPIQGLTFDGDAMSYAVGAEITGKEFNDFHETCDEFPGSSWYLWGGKWGVGLYEENGILSKEMKESFDAKKKYLLVKEGLLPIDPPRPHEIPDEIKQKIAQNKNKKRPLGPPVPEKPEGIVPLKSPEVKLVGPGDPPPVTRGGAAAGMSLHKTEGIFPKDGQATFKSCVPGLFAAGDSLASMLGGTNYPGLGFSSAGSCVQGARAGIEVGEYARSVALVEIDKDIIEKNKKEIFEPVAREKGFEASWVIQQLQNTMIPYYVLHLKEETRLNNALHTITYLRENLAPKIKAKDTHELKLAHETKNMLLNAEMKLRASLFRTESRGTHFREDYPTKNEDEWTAWVLIKRGNDGTMELSKKMVSK